MMTPKRLNQAARALSIGSNVVITLIIATRFSAELLGSYYLIFNLLFLQFVFEMGLSKVAAQIIARESHNSESSRMENFLFFFRRFYTKLSIYAGLAIFLFGIAIIPQELLRGQGLLYPWLTAAVFISVSIKLNGVIAEHEGVGEIKVVALSRLVRSSVFCVLSVSLLLLGLELHAVPLAMLVGAIFSLLFLLQTPILISPPSSDSDSRYEVYFWSDIWPFLKQTSATWVFGFLSYYCYVPFIAHLAGPEEAGRYGLTAQIIFTISSFSLILMQTRVFDYATKFEVGGIGELSTAFREDMVRALASYATLSACALLLVYPILAEMLGANETVGGTALVAMLIGGLAQTFYIGMGYFARAQNHEKFYWVNIVNAAFTLVALSLFAANGATGGAYIYCLTSLLSYFLLFPVIERKNIWIREGRSA